MIKAHLADLRSVLVKRMRTGADCSAGWCRSSTRLMVAAPMRSGELASTQ